LLDQLVQDIGIHDTEQYQEGSTDRAANDSTNCAETVKFR
jgi:hypothetical protein